MQTSLPPPYDWLKELEPELAKIDSSPLLGHPPVFSWKQFTQNLAAVFELDDLTLNPGEVQWRSANELYAGLPSPLIPVEISMSGFSGNVYWVLPEIDIPMLMSTLLEENSIPIHHVHKDYQEGFYRFLGIEIVNAFTQTDFDASLVPHFKMTSEHPSDHALCMDITLAFRHHSFTGRLIISTTFRKEWQRRYTTTSLINTHTERLASQAMLTVSLEAGRTSLLMKNWKKSRVGDFLLLENCSLTENFNTGKILINYHGSPIYVAELEDGNLKILQALQYHEAASTIEGEFMADDDFDEDLSMEEDNDFEQEDLEDDETSNDDDFDFEEEEESEEIEEKLDEEEEGEIEAEEEEEEAEEYKHDENEGASVTVKTVPPEGPINAENLPISLIIEVGKINISVQKLMELQAGNILELNVRPEEGVNLVINGRCVGKGELHRLGNTLGVRILELG